MLNILGYKGNANPNDIEILPHSIINNSIIIKKRNNSICWEAVGEKEHLYTVGGM
jgi:hypothetical protein